MITTTWGMLRLKLHVVCKVISQSSRHCVNTLSLSLSSSLWMSPRHSMLVTQDCSHSFLFNFSPTHSPLHQTQSVSCQVLCVCFNGSWTIPTSLFFSYNLINPWSALPLLTQAYWFLWIFLGSLFRSLRPNATSIVRFFLILFSDLQDCFFHRAPLWRHWSCCSLYGSCLKTPYRPQEPGDRIRVWLLCVTSPCPAQSWHRAGPPWAHHMGEVTRRRAGPR